MLTERQKMILSIIVEEYIRFAEPVGSRTISKREDIGFSPATIRNEMSDLEELGYLEQPHTSAGRIPSQKGYRFYVDHLLKHIILSPSEVERFVYEQVNVTEQALQQAAHTLSTMTNYTSIVLGPKVFEEKLKHFQLVPLRDDAAIAIIITDSGHVENKLFSLPTESFDQNLEYISNYLNAKLMGAPLFQLKSRLISQIQEDAFEHAELLSVLTPILVYDPQTRIHLSGMTNMLAQPEFKDINKLKEILAFLEETNALMDMIPNVSSGIQVSIGAENKHTAINQCSLITATFSSQDQIIGSISLLGPTRMEYAKVIAWLEYLSIRLTNDDEGGDNRGTKGN